MQEAQIADAPATSLPSNVGTDERVLKAGIDGFEVAPSGRVRIIAAPLDRLWKSGAITSREYQAGEKFRSDAYMAAIDPAAMTVDWNRAGGGGTSNRVPSMFTSQMLADARIRVREIATKIPERSVVSVVLYLGLVKEHEFGQIGRVVFGIRDAREAAVAGRTGVRVALASLADHYGS